MAGWMLRVQRGQAEWERSWGPPPSISPSALVTETPITPPPPHTHTYSQLLSKRRQPGGVAGGLCAGDPAPGPAACPWLGLGPAKTTERGRHLQGTGTPAGGNTLCQAPWKRSMPAEAGCGRHSSHLLRAPHSFNVQSHASFRPKGTRQ